MDEVIQWLMQSRPRRIGGPFALVLLAWLTALIARRALVRALQALALRTARAWIDVRIEHFALRRMTHVDLHDANATAGAREVTAEGSRP